MLPRADTYPPATARTLERHKHKQLPLAERTENAIATDSSYKHYHYLPTSSLAYITCTYLLQIWLDTQSVIQRGGGGALVFLTQHDARREKGLGTDISYRL